METIGFNFKFQYPQKALIKMIKTMFPHLEGGQGPSDEKQFLRVAYDMSIDIYKTFAPIKQYTFTIVLAILEVTALLTGKFLDRVRQFKPSSWHTDRRCVVETILDMLDLYTQYPKSTKIGSQYELQALIDTKININKTVEEEGLSRYRGWCDDCAEASDMKPVTPGSATSPATTNSHPGGGSVLQNGQASDGTMRFVFDADMARSERNRARQFFEDEYEEYEEVVEESVREPEQHQSSNRSSYSQRHPMHRNDHGHGPYRRMTRHPSDRAQGRRGHPYH